MSKELLNLLDENNRDKFENVEWVDAKIEELIREHKSTYDDFVWKGSGSLFSISVASGEKLQQNLLGSLLLCKQCGEILFFPLTIQFPRLLVIHALKGTKPPSMLSLFGLYYTAYRVISNTVSVRYQDPCDAHEKIVLYSCTENNRLRVLNDHGSCPPAHPFYCPNENSSLKKFLLSELRSFEQDMETETD